MQETLVLYWVGKIHWRRDRLPTSVFLGFSGGSAGKESTCSAGDLGLIPGLGRSLGEGKDYSLYYSGLENSMDCIVHGVSKSHKRLSYFHLRYLEDPLEKGMATHSRILTWRTHGQKLVWIEFVGLQKARYD